MKTKTLIIGAIAATTMLAGGWAVAQSVGPGGFGPPFMRGKGHDEMGPGMMKGMRHGKGDRMNGMDQGSGMMKGKGPGMMYRKSGFGPSRADTDREAQE